MPETNPPPALPAPPRPDTAEAPGSLSGVLLAGTRNLALNLPKRLFELDFELNETRDELKKKIAWIIRVRFFINPAVFLLMLFTNWQGLTHGASAMSRETLGSTAFTALFSVLLNVAYFYALRRERIELRKFVSLQLLLDILVFSAYVWRTGGVTSPFVFLYFLPIIGGSMLLSPSAGMGQAGLTSAAYLTIVVLESSGVIPHVSYFVALDQFAHRSSYIVLMVLVNLFAFVAVAATSGALIRRIQSKSRELEESNQLLERKANLLSTLYRVSEILQTHTNKEEVLDHICDVLVTDLNVDRALMYVIENNALLLKRVAYHQRNTSQEHASLRVTIPLDAHEGLTARAALENRVFNITEPEKQAGINRGLAERIGLNPFALAPMTYRHQVVGVLGVDRSTQQGSIRDDEAEVLQIFARHAGQTLALADRSEPTPRPIPQP